LSLPPSRCLQARHFPLATLIPSYPRFSTDNAIKRGVGLLEALALNGGSEVIKLYSLQHNQ